MFNIEYWHFHGITSSTPYCHTEFPLKLKWLRFDRRKTHNASFILFVFVALNCVFSLNHYLMMGPIEQLRTLVAT